ncbi:MAG: delta-60 repeat domain-containing protein [Algoriphagus aquaeductus]|uniref:delta-60 repeat domain-containing protein n=1 Tax=Algoriphagus aquaeductus TaxID=475299 RepID=UPI003879C7C1
MRHIYFTLLLFLLFGGISRGQNPGELDLSFNPNGINTGTGANQFVHASVRQPDGKIISVGNFTAYNGSARNRIIRINPDGTLDPTFNIGTGADGRIWTVALQADGKILIGGDFTLFNGVPRSGIARLNSDGSVDSNFTIGSGFDGRVYSIFIQHNEKILVGGEFGGFNGVSRRYSARLETTGILDLSYFPGFQGGGVRSIVSTSDGSIYLAGGFTFNIVKLTSSGAPVNNWCQCGISGLVFALHVQSDDKLLVGGNFNLGSTITGNRRNLVRINPNGVVDTSFTFSGLDITSYILSISPTINEKILIAGNFQTQRFCV